MFLDWERVDKEQVISLLKELNHFYSSPDNWIDWPIAVNELNLEVAPDDPSATKWSFLGACEFLSGKIFPYPESIFVSSATREYLNNLSSDKLIHGKCDYFDEYKLINFALSNLESKD